MKHYDENIIELIVLDSSEITGIKNEFEEHIKQCNTCRELFQEITDFYAALSKQNTNLINDQKLLRTSSIDVTPSYREVVIKNEEFFPSRIIKSIVRNPIKSGFTIAAALALGYVGINLSINKSHIESNPSYLITNDSLKAVEVYNINNKFLWDIKWNTKMQVNDYQNEINIDFAVIDDLNNDESNELISGIPLLAGIDEPNVITIIDKEKTITKEAHIGSLINYGGKNYSNNFSTRGVIVNDYDWDGYKEIIVGAYNTHSPYVVTRLDNKGGVLGEYWHYGHFWGISEIDLHNDGKKEILLCGQNDEINEPVFIILDPQKIVGKKQSLLSTNFGLENSAAELFAAKFTETSFEKKIGVKKRRFIKLIDEGNNEISIFLNLFAEETNPLGLGFIFDFDREMNLLTIQPNDSAIRLFEASTNATFTPNSIQTLKDSYSIIFSK